MKKGFTLLELIVVVAIITVLAGILAPLVKNSLDDAKVGKVLGLVDSIKKACAKYHFDTGVLPADGDAFLVKPAAVATSAYKGPYMDQPINDGLNPWGTFTFNATSNGNTDDADGYLIAGAAGTDEITNGCEIVLATVPTTIADAIDAQIDGAAGANVGRCELDAASGGTKRVSIFVYQQ